MSPATRAPWRSATPRASEAPARSTSSVRPDRPCWASRGSVAPKVFVVMRRAPAVAYSSCSAATASPLLRFHDSAHSPMGARGPGGATRNRRRTRRDGRRAGPAVGSSRSHARTRGHRGRLRASTAWSSIRQRQASITSTWLKVKTCSPSMPSASFAARAATRLDEPVGGESGRGDPREHRPLLAQEPKRLSHTDLGRHPRAAWSARRVRGRRRGGAGSLPAGGPARTTSRGAPRRRSCSRRCGWRTGACPTSPGP